MKRWLTASAIVVLLVFVLELGLRRIPTHVYDGFEASGLSWSRWSRGRLVPRAVAMEHEIVRSGKSALAITVHSGDRYEPASDNGAATERDELMESWWLFARTGRTYAYSFSLYLPKEIPLTSQRLVIAQWRQLCEARRCRPDYPVLALRLENGCLRVTRRDEGGSHLLYEGTQDARGKWLDFRFVVKFDSISGSVD